MTEINLADILNQAKSFKTSGGKFAKATFLPNGNHVGRFILPPNGQLFCQFTAYGYFSKGIRHPKDIADSELPAGFVDEITSLNDNILSPAGKWKFGPKYVNLMYFYLTSTDSKEDGKWEPGNLYALILKSKHLNQITNWITTSSAEAPELIVNGLNPAKESYALTLSLIEGNMSVSVKFPTVNIPPINMDEQAYVDLDQAYIRPGFDKEKYNNLVTQYKEEAKAADPVAYEIWTAKGSVPAEYWEEKFRLEEEAKNGGAAPAADVPPPSQGILAQQQAQQAEVNQQPATQSQPAAQQAEVTTQQSQPVQQAESPAATQSQPAATAGVAEDPFARFKV